MEFQINTDFAALEEQALAEYAVKAREALQPLLALDTPTADEVAAAEALADHVDAIAALQNERVAEATALAERAAALRARFATEETETEVEVEAESEEVVEAEVEVETEVEKPKVAARASSVAALATKTKRPAAPATSSKPISITAAADVPDFATGSPLADMAEVGKALVNRMKGFGVPSGDGSTENLQHYGVAKFQMEFPEELTIKPQGGDDMAVLQHAASESRLEGKSLVAAGGWCAPSETLYDLCVTETLDGILSVPEVNVSRGGMRFTKGPDFSTIYSSVGFLQTEAQAIAGTAKTCFEVTCPTWTDVRLDAIGLCIKAPILTNAAYPELVNRWLSGAMIAHAHKVNASVIGRMATAAGAAMTVTDFTSTAHSTLANLEYVTDGLRQKYKMGLTETMEVVLPYWVKGAIRNDLALRGGRDIQAVTDAMITAEFSARYLRVSFVYDWQELADVTQEGYPATFNALIYPAGTFVKGTSDVISLNAVYDAASLATNIYTALFFEQGLLVANVCNEAKLVTIPVCGSGHTGVADIDVCGLLVP